jgi:hypothetical protein
MQMAEDHSDHFQSLAFALHPPLCSSLGERSREGFGLAKPEQFNADEASGQS